MKRAYAKRLQEVFTRDIGIPFVISNGYDVAPPRLEIDVRREDKKK
jgi:hypothetical protein